MIKLVNVSKYYKTANGVSLGINKINLSFSCGEFVALIGESGSGKSTLLNVISALDTYEDGQLYLFGEDVSHYTTDDWENYRSKYIGFVFQKYNVIESYTVLQNVLLALEIQGYPQEKRLLRAQELIEKVGLKSRIKQKASRLSGGEKQRLVIARSLAKDCQIIIADEPTGNLDSQSGKIVIELLKEISKDKLVIVSTHNYNEIQDYATRRIRLHDNEVIEDKELKPTEKHEATILEKSSTVPFLTTVMIALRNLFATPKRLVFSLMLQIFIIAIYAVLYGLLMSGRDILLSDVNNDVTSMRMTIIKKDGSPIDKEVLRTNPLVRDVSIYPHAQEAYAGFFKGNQDFGIVNGHLLMENASSLNSQDLVEGRLPIGEKEVVISLSLQRQYRIKIGDYITACAYFHRQSLSRGDVYTVTGVSQVGNSTSVFFHGNIFSNKLIALLGSLKSSSQLHIVGYYTEKDYLYFQINLNALKIDYSTDQEKVVLNPKLIENPNPPSVQFSKYSWIELQIASSFGEFHYDDLRNLPIYDETGLLIEDANNQVIISYPVIEKIIANLYDQYTSASATIFVRDTREARLLLKSINHSEYKLLYSLEADNDILTESEYLAIVILLIIFVGFALFSILGVVLKNINLARNNDYAIFRSIGASNKMLSLQVIIEQLFLSIISFGVAVLLVFIIGRFFYPITIALTYLSFGHFLILLFISMFFSIRNGLKYHQIIFNLSVISTLESKMEERI